MKVREIRERKQKYERFKNNISQRNIPIDQQKLKEIFDIVLMYQDEKKIDECINECIKQFPSKIRLPLKTIIKNWKSSQNSPHIYKPLQKFFTQIQIGEQLSKNIWISFQNKDLNNAKNCLSQHLKYQDSEKDKKKYLQQLENIYKSYNKGPHENQTPIAPEAKKNSIRFNIPTPLRLSTPNSKFNETTPLRPSTPGKKFNEPTPNSFQLKPSSSPKIKSNELTPNSSQLSQLRPGSSKKYIKKLGQLGQQQKSKYYNSNSHGLEKSFNQILDLKLNPNIAVQPGKNINSKFIQSYKSVLTYFIQKMVQKGMWDTYSNDNEQQQQFIKDINQFPHLYDIFIQKHFKRNNKTISIIQQAKEDQKFIKLLNQSLKYSLHDLYNQMQKKSANQSILYSVDVNIKNWQIRQILQQTKRLFHNFVGQLMEQQKYNTQNFILKIVDLVFDILTRKGNLPLKIAQINKIATQRNHQTLKEIKIYDFLVLFIKIVQKQKMPNLGYLLHKNFLSIPLITCTISEGKKQYFQEMSLLENILLDKNMKMICSIGTQLVQRKGKTQLLSGIFKYEMNSSSDIFCQFHKNCLNLYTNLQSITEGHSVILADFHGHINDFKQNKIFQKIIDNSCLILLHIHQKESEKIDRLVKSIQNENVRIIVIVRDSLHEKILINNQKNFQKITLQPLYKQSQSDKQTNFKNILNLIIKELNLSNNFVDYKNLVEQQKQNYIFQQEKLQNQILRQMQQYKINQIWNKCFPNIQLFRDIYLSELKMLNLQRLIKYDRKDQRHLQYMQIIQQIQKKRKIVKQKKALLAKVTSIYYNNFQKINIRSLNCKISDWKKPFIQKLEKQLVDLKVRFQKNRGNQNKLRQEIQRKQNQLKQFDISIDTFIQEITIVSNYNNQFEKYQKCVKNYYNELYKAMNPINLIDGNTLLFGNPLLKKFFQQISSQIPKNKKIYVVSVIGIQSSAKSTLMNYLFNCCFETSAGRCTKGAYFTISQTKDEVYIIIDTEGLMSVSARDRVFDIQIASFTFLVSDIVIINNKGEINTPIRQLLGVCTWALKQLNQRKKQKQKSKVFFAIRDQNKAGVNVQKSMLSDIIRDLDKDKDLADYSQFLDFNSEDIYPLESAFSQITIGMDTIMQKPSYNFSQAVMTMRSKIIKYLKQKKSIFEDVITFYNESQKYWDAIRKCGQHIFNFQQVFEIRIKKELKQYQQQLLNEKFQQIGKMISQSVKQIEDISNNQKLRNYKNIIMDNIQKASIQVRNQIRLRGEETKGAKSQYIRDLIDDTKRQFNSKVIMHTQFIDNLQKQRIKKNKMKNFQSTISTIIASIIKSDKTLDNIKNQYDKQCSKLLAEQEYKFEDTQLLLQGVMEKEVEKYTKYKIDGYIYRSAVNNSNKFDIFFEVSFLKMKKEQLGISLNQKASFVKLIQQKFDTILKQLVKVNNKFLPIIGQNNQRLIIQFKEKIDEVIQIIKLDLQKKTQKWAFNSIKLNQQKFRLYCFAIFCKQMPKLIIKNRQTIKQKESKQKKELINKKWQQIKKSFSIKGDSFKISNQMIEQFQNSILNQLYEEAKKALLNTLVTLISKFSPVKMIEQAMRLTFKSTQNGKATWIKCFKAIYNMNAFLKQQILYQQNQYTQLKKNIDIQKQNTNSSIPKKLQSVKSKLQTIKKFEQIGLILNIDIKIFQYDENIKKFQSILTQIKNKFQGVQLSNLTQKIRSKVYESASIFDNLEDQLNKYVRQNIMSQIIGCQTRCPICSMKCKLSKNHQEGHKCVEGSHLQSCFSGIKNQKTNERSQNMCFTQQHIDNVVYFEGQDPTTMSHTLEHIQNKYQQWYDHFKQGPYQDRINQLNCQRIWANIGHVLIATKFKGRGIQNNNIIQGYINNPLQLKDIQQWVKTHQEQEQQQLQMLKSLLLLLKLKSIFG